MADGHIHKVLCLLSKVLCITSPETWKGRGLMGKPNWSKANKEVEAASPLDLENLNSALNPMCFWVPSNCSLPMGWEVHGAKGPILSPGFPPFDLLQVPRTLYFPVQWLPESLEVACGFFPRFILLMTRLTMCGPSPTPEGRLWGNVGEDSLDRMGHAYWDVHVHAYKVPCSESQVQGWEGLKKELGACFLFLLQPHKC